MKKKIIEVTLDVSTVLDKQVIVECGIDIPFKTEEQKTKFNKQLAELVSTATETIKNFIDSSIDCDCDKCKARREKKGGFFTDEVKPRYRTY